MASRPSLAERAPPTPNYTLPVTRPPLVLVLLALVALPACTSMRPDLATIPATRPADFRLDLTRFAPDDDPAAGRRYVVEADGVLRGAIGPGVETEFFPGRTRPLTADELDELWATVRADALATEGAPAPSTRDLGVILSHGAKTTRVTTDAERAANTLALLDRLAWLD